MKSRGPMLTCIGCGESFWRRRTGHDARRYCSRACAFAHWRDVRLSDIRSVRARSRPKPTHPCRRCSQPIELRKQLCENCREVARWEQAEINRQIGRQRPRHPRPPIPHTCPSCGGLFSAPEDAVFCSPICTRRARKVTKGLRLSRVPLAEREILAQWVVLVRQANQRIDDLRKCRPLR